MASFFTHAFVAGVAGTLYARHTRESMLPRFWVSAVLLSALPDADVIGFALGVRYEDFLGHRGFSHSLVFALLVGALWTSVWFRDRALFSRRWWSLVAFFSMLTASHGVLDATTDGGLGIAFFSPFDNQRYFFPWTPVQVSPIGIANFFNQRGFNVLLSEIRWLWMPMAIVALVWCLAVPKRRTPG